jgi:hypothetical protein
VAWPGRTADGAFPLHGVVDVKILNNLGVALACKGMHEETVIRFREALRRSPDYEEAGDNLAKAMMELKGSVRP